MRKTSRVLIFTCRGLVTKKRRGRRNHYTLNEPAILSLEPFTTIIKHTTPLPDQIDTPDQEGANSSIDSTKNSSGAVDLPFAENNVVSSALSLSSISQDVTPDHSGVLREIEWDIAPTWQEKKAQHEYWENVAKANRAMAVAAGRHEDEW